MVNNPATHILLTHEQADLDALASLLGASLLYPRALALLPGRINRNGRAFLTLYGSELPFVEWRDAVFNNVEHITLVDTQTLITVRGAGEHTQVEVIDHHTLRPDLPKHWKTTIEPLGAATTLLVEALREHQISFNHVQATLLLLGIYEDTGSLTYTRTTPRDVLAAAYLLEHGANLDIARRYLDHPLSQAQEQLLRQLQDAAETHTIHGRTILVTTGDASGVDEELSTIAHKLRNLLEPDGLFLLIATRVGVQLIARSTHDGVHVGEVAALFGGGGHQRAAAALVQDSTPAEVKERLLGLLPGIVQPGLQVAQLMSSRPQVIDAATPAEKAAALMQRFGYEGFPVTEDDQLVGLLTRRAVDRALAHNLNLPARSLMQTGQITVGPQDSLETLQARMVTSGWGQVPVVDEDGQIIGIVTRTDLLRSLLPAQPNGESGQYRQRLQAALPPVHLALLRLAGQTAEQANLPLYIVGGFVRDLLLDHPSLDIDLVVEGDAIQLAQRLRRQYGGHVISHARFGTAKWLLRHPGNPPSPDLIPALYALLDNKASFGLEDLPQFLDFISARTEFYTHPTALPTVEHASIKLDLHRRDFTINTLALRLDAPHTGKLLDFWGGLEDLRRREVRVLHSLSFIDDPTRILRAIRYEQRYGFNIEARTLELLQEARNLLDRVSGERLRNEFDHILDEPNFPAMLQRAQHLELLKQVHPGLAWQAEASQRVRQALARHPQPLWNLPEMYSDVPLRRLIIYSAWLGGFELSTIQGVLQRLDFPHSLRQPIVDLPRLITALPGLTSQPPSQITAALEEFSALSVFVAWRLTGADALLHFARDWRNVQPVISGDDLRAMGLRPGPRYRVILGRLRQAWLDGEVHSADQERALLDQLLKEPASER